MKKTKKIESLLSKLDDVKIGFENLKDEQQIKYDDKSEKWQESEKGEKMLQDIEDIEEIVENLENSYNNIENLFEED